MTKIIIYMLLTIGYSIYSHIIIIIIHYINDILVVLILILKNINKSDSK